MTWSPRHLANLIGLVFLAALAVCLIVKQPVLALALGLGSAVGIVCAFRLAARSPADDADEQETSTALLAAQRLGAIVSALVALLIVAWAWVFGFVP